MASTRPIEVTLFVLKIPYCSNLKEREKKTRPLRSSNSGYRSFDVGGRAALPDDAVPVVGPFPELGRRSGAAHISWDLKSETLFLYIRNGFLSLTQLFPYVAFATRLIYADPTPTTQLTRGRATGRLQIETFLLSVRRLVLPFLTLYQRKVLHRTLVYGRECTIK